MTSYAYGDVPAADLIDGHLPAEVRAGEDRATRASPPATFPQPEDRGKARLSPLGEVEYVEDLIRPGRIVTWAAEEGSGKSYTVTGELAIRLAIAGGDFAGTWGVLELGAVLVLSEMHADEDFQREETILASLGCQRVQLVGGYYRLPLMTAAGGAPVLTDDAWRTYITAWCRDAHIKLLIFDTATGATQVEPWGKAIQEVFRNLRVMLDEVPELAVILIVHCRKPQGRGQRAISDVLGEWGRWCDVVVMQESDGALGERAKLSTYKRVRHPRRIVAMKAGGLLIDPVEISEGPAPKVPLAKVVEAVAAAPGITATQLAERLGISRSTAQDYGRAAASAGLVERRPGGLRGALLLFALSDRPEVSDEHVGQIPDGHRTDQASEVSDRPTDLYRSDSRTLDSQTVEETEEELLQQLRMSGGRT